MKALKVQIESLSEEWDIEVKESDTVLHMIIIRSKWNGRSDPKTWSAQIADHTFFPDIHKWMQQAHKNPHRTKKITINDGTLFTISYADDDNTFQLTISNFEENTNEYFLAEKLLDFCMKQTHEDAQIVSLKDYWKSSARIDLD